MTDTVSSRKLTEHLERLDAAVNETPQAVVQRRCGLGAEGGPHG